MKYFRNAAERKAGGGTLYFEFQKGKFKNKHWLENSMYLYADVFDSLMLYRLFADSIDGFNYYGPTEVSKEQWNTLVKKSEEDETWKDVIKELKPWAEECFTENMCISICGI